MVVRFISWFDIAIQVSYPSMSTMRSIKAPKVIFCFFFFHSPAGGKAAHLVCAGVGGQVGWYMCYHYPQLVSKMVLIHAPHPYVIRQHFNSLWMNYYKAW